jgi:hypothetical protein
MCPSLRNCLAVIAIIGLTLSGYAQSAKGTEPSAPRLSLYDLVSEADQYLGQSLMLDVVTVTTFDTSHLVDQSGRKTHRPVLYNFACQDRPDCMPNLQKELAAGTYLENGAFKIRMLVLGTLVSTNENILDGCPCYKFRIDKIEKVFPPPEGSKVLKNSPR